jgi:hypothetical protein
LKNSKTPKTEILYVGNSLEDFESSKYFKINFIHFQNEYLPKLVNNTFPSINTMNELQKCISRMNV